MSAFSTKITVKLNGKFIHRYTQMDTDIFDFKIQIPDLKFS